MNTYPSKLLEKAVGEISRLPGIGRKTALRLSLHLLRQDEETVDALANALSSLRHDVKYCTVCHNISDDDICPICADGRRDGWSDKGMTLQELQQVFVEQGCQVAYNLDGGGSATMVLNGELVNKTSGSRERNVSDIIYFTK